MPKVAAYTLAWSSTTQTYMLYKSHDQGPLSIVLESPEWFDWLDQVTCFAFSGKAGHYTARMETKQRGDRYWYAYFTTGGRRTKKYLGKTPGLTLARLEHIMHVSHADQASTVQPGRETPFPPIRSEAQVIPPVSLAPASADSRVDTAHHSILPQQRDPPHTLLATKLHVPRPRTHLVPRSHLTRQLQQGSEHVLTLVSAPAGFGKTTLLAQWLAESNMPVAWLSLEPEDNDPVRFLSYVIAALQTIDAHIGKSTLPLLQALPPAPAEAVLAVLTNDLMSHEEDFVLVLDDYHAITAKPIHHALTFLLEHLPPHMHLMLATRSDPPLPLARLRACGRLTELRTTELRFAREEVSAFLHTVMGLDLAPEDITTLERRTEGWVAGLQLAALSLRGRADISSFLTSFSGCHQFVLEYLSEEVLSRQPESVQSFLLHTCILERLSGSLCDAVTGQDGSQAALEALDKANLFVVSLDGERRWYRYHQLFAEMLRNRLEQTQSMLVPQLHRRASAWCEQHQLPVEAVQHALAIPDFELAARLIEPIALPTALQGQFYTVLGWLHALPDVLMQAHPFLCLYHAALLMFNGQLEQTRTRLWEAEQGVHMDLPADRVRVLQGMACILRASMAEFSGEITHAVSLARQARLTSCR